MKAIRFLSPLVILVSMLALFSCGDPASLPSYYAPVQNARYVSPGATIIVRYGPELSARDLAAFQLSVQGGQSGRHEGDVILADDLRTIIFDPARPFTPGEQVSVDIPALRLDAGESFARLAYSFTVATNQQPGTVTSTKPNPANKAPKPAFPHFMTLPQDIPHYTVSKAPAAEGQDYIFVAPFYWTKTSTGSYLLILNRQGQVVYYQSMVDDLGAFDFKRQPNGLLSYWNQKDLTIYLLDAHYHVVDTYRAGNGYEADLHDFQLLPNGYALLMAYDAQTVDMSKVVLGGKRDATVTGLVIQEIDPSKNVIWEWRSWDHIAFHESTVDLTKQEVDLVHGNALALANDGNLLLSSRNLCEITKIDLQTGEVIWRLGGRANQFRFVGGEPFAYQHDVRQLPNGHITLFDNHGTTEEPAPSYGLEYEIDETTKIATQVWQYEHQPPVFGAYMGNVQRLADGNTFISWGSPFDIPGEALAYVSMTEVGQDKGTLFEMAFDEPYVSYRAFLFPWQGFPDTPPALAFRAEGRGLRFGYSWNGATEVASWRLYGGSSAQGLAPIEEKVRADFETQSYLSSVPAGQCYFQVAALDRDGKEMARSEVVSTDSVRCPAVP